MMKPTLKVTVTTAVELTKKQVGSILKAVEKNHFQNTETRDQEIELKQVVDPSVIAGIKLTVGNEEIDSTVYTKLEKLHAQLRENI